MYCEQEIAKDLYWIGGDDGRLGVFEGHHPVPDGMAYNTYLLLDEKTVLLDTIDRAVEERFYATLDHLLGSRKLDYLIVNHIEPDHSATLGEVVRRHPEVQLICTKIAKSFIQQFYDEDMAERAMVVADGDSLDCGTRTLSFATAPMVHWPEVMVTYDIEDKILFSADAFGSFGAHNGRLYDFMYDFNEQLLPEMRRYYTNIVGKYGTQTSELLDKASTLEIDMICPLHGPLIRDNIDTVISKHRLWAAYEPEDKGVVIAYASIYGGTRDVAEALAFKLSDLGIHDLALFDLSVTDPSYVLAEAFRVTNIVLASVTYNAGMFPAMEELVAALVSHNLRKRNFSFIQNGSWGPISGRLMRKAIEDIPEAQIIGETFTIKSRMKPQQGADLDALAQAIYDSIINPPAQPDIEVHEIASAPPSIVGATRTAPPKAAPPPISASTQATATKNKPVAQKPAVLQAPKGVGEQSQETKIVQVWRCTYCGHQAEVPKGTDMSTFVCPVCFHVGKGLFVLVREKIVPVQ